MDIKDYRKEIDKLDTEIVEAFCRRMDISAEIGKYKKNNALPVRNPVREEELMNRIKQLAGDELSGYAEALYSVILELSRAYQERDDLHE